MATKQDAKARNAAWRKALAEGRVVRYNGGMTLTSNKTVHDAKMLVFALRDNGDESAEIVTGVCTDPNCPQYGGRSSHCACVE